MNLYLIAMLAIGTGTISGAVLRRLQPARLLGNLFYALIIMSDAVSHHIDRVFYVLAVLVAFVLIASGISVIAGLVIGGVLIGFYFAFLSRG